MAVGATDHDDTQHWKRSTKTRRDETYMYMYADKQHTLYTDTDTYKIINHGNIFWTLCHYEVKKLNNIKYCIYLMFDTWVYVPVPVPVQIIVNRPYMYRHTQMNEKKNTADTQYQNTSTCFSSTLHDIIRHTHFT